MGQGRLYVPPHWARHFNMSFYLILPGISGDLVSAILPMGKLRIRLSDCPQRWVRQKLSGSQQGLNMVSPAPGSVTRRQPKAPFQNLSREQGLQAQLTAVCLPDSPSPFPVGENQFPGSHSLPGSLPPLGPGPGRSQLHRAAIAGYVQIRSKGAARSDNTLGKPSPHWPLALRTLSRAFPNKNCLPPARSEVPPQSCTRPPHSPHWK